MVLLQSNYTFPRIQRSPTFSRGGGPTFSRGGIQMLISIETHITCDFPGGGSGPPVPLLDPHMGSDCLWANQVQ